jgi:hypothetical protein
LTPRDEIVPSKDGVALVATAPPVRRASVEVVRQHLNPFLCQPNGLLPSPEEGIGQTK